MLGNVACPRALHLTAPQLGIEPGTPGSKSPTLTTRPRRITHVDGGANLGARVLENVVMVIYPEKSVK